jgi:hypothetical protein
VSHSILANRRTLKTVIGAYTQPVLTTTDSLVWLVFKNVVQDNSKEALDNPARRATMHFESNQNLFPMLAICVVEELCTEIISSPCITGCM